MKYRNINVVTFSPTGTSRTVAESIAKGMTDVLPKKLYHRISATDLTTTPPGGQLYIRDSITVVAAPVYGGRLAELAATRFGNLKGIRSVAVPVVLYGNRDYEDALLELSDLLEERGFEVIAGGAFIGEHSYSRPEMPTAQGRPDRRDLNVSENFGKSVAEKILSAIRALPEDTEEEQPVYSRPSIKGNRPYKEKKASTPQTPECDAELCFHCGACASVCPAGAVEVFCQGPVFDSRLCIKCCACVKNCPAEALKFVTPYTEKLFRNCRERKEPETFL